MTDRNRQVPAILLLIIIAELSARNVRAALIFFAAIGMLVAMALMARAVPMHYPIPPEPGTPADSPEYAEYWAERNKVELRDLREEVAAYEDRDSAALGFLVGFVIAAIGTAVVQKLFFAPPPRNVYVP